MDRRAIQIRYSDGRIEDAWLDISEMPPWKLAFSGGRHTVECEGADLFEALARLREELAKLGVMPLCAGARRDVFPSGMSRSMGGGRKAYLTRLGYRTGPADLVDIFDVARENISSVADQAAFHRQWIESLRRKQ
jgi:hypothetical protein